jgi:hypothetical protein
MPGWGRARWRPVAAGAVICAVVVAVVLVLVDAGLGAAASLVGVLSVVSVIGTVAAWGPHTRRSSPERIVARQVALAGLLRDIAEAHAWSRDKIREALGERDADAVLDGTSLPGWAAVAALIAVVAGADQGIREGLEHLVRPVWEAARKRDAEGGDGASATVLVQVSAEAGMRLAVSQQTAEASRAAGRLQESAAGLESWRAGFAFMLGKYASAITTLTTERDGLAAQLAAQQERESGHAAQAALLAGELRDVRARLVLAERQREQVRRLLAETEAKLRDAKAIRDDAVAQTARSRRDLARLEHRTVPATPALAAPAANDPHRLLGEADQQLSQEIIGRADAFLREQDAVLSQDAATVARLTKTSGRPRASHLRTAVVLATILAVAAGLGAFALSKDAQPPIPYRIAILSIPGRSIGAAKSVAFSPSGTTLAVGYGDGRTDLWNPATHKITATLPGPDGSSSTAESVAFSPNGTTLAVGNENGSTYLWNVPG